MNSTFLNRPLIWGVRTWQWLIFLLFYLLFAFQYWLAIWLTTDGGSNIWRETLIDYFGLKLPLTIPIWWLYFVYWRDKNPRFKLRMHLLTGPAWVFSWFHIYRIIQDFLGGAYLRGDGIWWDVYIPGLVYCVQFAIFHVYDYYLETKKQKQKEQQLLQAAYNSEVNALKAQIQPHFLFNTLNSISASIPAELEHSRELIAKLADTFRYSLHASEQEWITLAEEIQFIRITLDLEKERLKKRLTVIYDLDESLLQTRIPPMLLQPITENAIKHGIAPSIVGGTVTITVKKEGSDVRIKICDTGLGYTNGEPGEEIFSKGIGLRNTKLRLEKLYNEKITVMKNQPSGLCFSFTIPLQHD